MLSEGLQDGIRSDGNELPPYALLPAKPPPSSWRPVDHWVLFSLIAHGCLLALLACLAPSHSHDDPVRAAEKEANGPPTLRATLAKGGGGVRGGGSKSGGSQSSPPGGTPFLANAKPDNDADLSNSGPSRYGEHGPGDQLDGDDPFKQLSFTIKPASGKPSTPRQSPAKTAETELSPSSVAKVERAVPIHEPPRPEKIAVDARTEPSPEVLLPKPTSQPRPDAIKVAVSETSLEKPLVLPKTVSRPSLAELKMQPVAAPPVARQVAANDARPEGPSENGVATETRSAAGDRRQGSGTGGNPNASRLNSLFASNPLPPYPPEAVARGVEGIVLLRIRINEDGSVKEVTIAQSSGNRLLDDSALSTVRDKWKFTPNLLGGIEMSPQMLLPIHFQLHDRT